MLVVNGDGEGNGTPLQHSCLENPMDGGAWWAAVHEVAKSRIRLSDFPFTFNFPALEKKMATYSSVLAWRILGTVEPSGLPSMGSHRVEYDGRDLAAAAASHKNPVLMEFTFYSSDRHTWGSIRITSRTCEPQSHLYAPTAAPSLSQLFSH